MGGCFLSLAVIFFLIGLVQLFAPDSRTTRQKPVPQREWPREPAPMPVSRYTVPQDESETPDLSDPGSAPVASGGKSLESFPKKFAWIHLGQRITVQHPLKGELMAHVLGRIRYTELWQRRRDPQTPWTPTGNVFFGFWLEGDLFLLNWQNRVYLLDESTQLSDADIQRDFLPHARKFAQSDQTADVYFAYPPAMWHIDDIGKFQVESTEGEGLHFRTGAVGRFIHASGDSGRALVLEDYESGGSGQDTVWIGYSTQEDLIRPA